MKFSQIERGINNFSVASRGGDKKFNRVFHPVSTTPPRELKNDNSLRCLLLKHRLIFLLVFLYLTRLKAHQILSRLVKVSACILEEGT